MRIPSGIGRKVIEDWLNGLSRDEIAQKNGLSSGTISNIVSQESEANELGLEFIRPISKLLKREDIKFNELIGAIRILNRLKEMKMTGERAEKYLESMDEYCFREQIEPEKFIESIAFLANLPDENRNVQLLAQNVKMNLQKITSQNTILNELNHKSDNLKKTLGKLKEEERFLLSNLSDYKKIKEVIDHAKWIGVSPYVWLSIVIYSERERSLER